MVNLWAFATIPGTMIDTLSFCLHIMVKQKPGSVGGYEVVQTKDGFTLCEAEEQCVQSDKASPAARTAASSADKLLFSLMSFELSSL